MGKRRSRFFRWIKSDLPNCEKNPVLLLGVTKIATPRSSIQFETSAGGGHREHQRQRPKTVVVETTNSSHNREEFDKRSSLGVFTTQDDTKSSLKLYDNRQRQPRSGQTATSNFYIELSPPSLLSDKQSKSKDNSSKIGLNTSSTAAPPSLDSHDKNSNGKQQEEAFLPQFSSFEINKNNKIFDRRENLTKKNSFETTEDHNTTPTSIKHHQFHHQSSVIPSTKQQPPPPPPPQTPKVLITRIKSLSHKNTVENVIVDTQPKSSALVHVEVVPQQQPQKKKSSNCRIYGFIPKCAKRNDSTEPESLSEETNNNLELIRNRISVKSKNNSLIMDRSVDSIGSCSLDVDADSTDFSDTSGSLNLVTPSSGKDFQREFTSRIQERVHIPLLNQQQHTTTILDPTSGKITTILSSPVNEIKGGLKKPSYLNLACCVNGYSNLTTYDSKLRQNINKSREVSPIRPITHTLQYSRETGGNYLVVPVPVPVKLDTSAMETNHRTMSKEKRLFTSKMMSSGEDVVDDAGMNIKNYRSTKIIKTQSTMSSITTTSIPDTPSKSFIQQRVERLYGPGALAQGFYTNKRISDGNGNISTNVLSEKYPENNIHNINILNGHNNVILTTTDDVEKPQLNDNDQTNSLPVLRHLRPEFRAQLPISPKRGGSSINTGENNIITTTTTTSSTTIHNNKINGFTDTIKNTTHIDNSHHRNYINLENNCSSTAADAKPTIIISNKSSQNLSPSQSAQMNGCDSTTNAAIAATLTQDPISSSINKMAISNGDDKSLIANSVVNIDVVSSSSNDKQKVCNGGGSDPKVNGDHVNNQKIEQGDGVVPVMQQDVPDAERDGHYFMAVLNHERSRLLAEADKVEFDMEEILSQNLDVSEEILGYLRSATGKARLLATKKMKQFEGLCHHNLNPDDEIPTHASDLQGFWDMVMLQVTHVDSLFEEIQSWKANNWRKPVIEKPTPPQGAKLTKRPTATKASSQNGSTSTASSSAAKSAASKAAAQKREEQRKKLAELRKKSKLEQKEQPNGVEIFIAGESS